MHLPPSSPALLAAPVARMFRRILSGADDGRPPWVRALEQPGDAGWFGPGSEVWRVHGSLATLVGGVRALLLQSAHPLALAGVEQHSDYRADPLGRLQRTNLFVTTTTFGSTEQAADSVRRVLTVHRAVVGRAPDGRPYAANDPHLLLWVHVALIESMLRAAQRYGPDHLDADRDVAETAIIADEFGIPDPPRSEAALAATLEAFRPELVGDEHTREVVRFLLRPPLPAAAQPVYQLLLRAACDLLPDWGREVLELPRRGAPFRRFDRLAAAVALDTLGLVLGRGSPGERAARQRIAGSVEPDASVPGGEVDGDDSRLVAVDPLDLDVVERVVGRLAEPGTHRVGVARDLHPLDPDVGVALG